MRTLVVRYATSAHSVIPGLDDRGLLPPGRYRATTEEVETTFISAPAYGASTTRRVVWDDFLHLVELLRAKHVRLPAAFLGGSFTSSDVDPSDVDVTLLYDSSKIQSQALYAEILRITDDPKGNLGLQVDAFTIPWWPEGDDRMMRSAYLCDRGRWDDFWQRHVPKSERFPPQRAHAMPVRGYLEVLLDGYR